MTFNLPEGVRRRTPEGEPIPSRELVALREIVSSWDALLEAEDEADHFTPSDDQVVASAIAWDRLATSITRGRALVAEEVQP